MIPCPNCNKHITTIPGKYMEISCLCKYKLIINDELLAGYTFQTVWQDKPLTFQFFFCGNLKDLDIFVDGARILHFDHHPKINPSNCNDWLERIFKLKAFF